MKNNIKTSLLLVAIMGIFSPLVAHQNTQNTVLKVVNDDIRYYMNDKVVTKEKFQNNLSVMKEIEGTNFVKNENGVKTTGYHAEDMNGVKYEVLTIKKEGKTLMKINFIQE